MKFDRTFIAIRERSTADLFDLGLHVTVDHIRPLLWLLLINAAPWILIDLLLLHWMTDPSYSPALNAAYYWAMIALVISQSQVGTFLITQYLGKAMFVGRPRVREVLRDAFRISPMYWFLQGIPRTVFISLAICLTFDGDTEYTIIGVYFFLTLSVVIGLIVRAFRPYLSAILLLEKTPIRSKSGAIHLAARSKSLHSFASGDLLGKAMVSLLFGGLLTLAIHSFLVTLDSIMNIRANSEYSLQPYYLVVSLWIVSGYLAVVRFLSYIDLRIRQEGWAVELRVRAEAQRLNETA